MNSTDTEEIATSIIKNQVLRNKKYLKAYIDENDRTPFWDGSIWIYNNEQKTTEHFENKIDIQIKGRKVPAFKKNNTYQMDVKYLKGYQKEIKGTLLLVVDFINIDNYKIYYVNLLPVELYQIFKNIKEGQKTVSLELKEINERSALNFKNVCINFYKNSNKQANKRIIDESEFNNIEELKFQIYTKKSEYKEYLENADVYTYAKLKDTSEEVVTVKGSWKSLVTIYKDVFVNGKKYYSEYSVVGKDANELLVGPITVDMVNNKVQTKITGSPKKRIKALKFIIDVLKEKYIMLGNIKFNLPFNGDETIINYRLDIYHKQIKYFKKIVKLFSFFKTDFDIDYSTLSEEDVKNLHFLMTLYNGIFPEKLKEMQKYYICINKYKFIFVLDYGKNKLYNFYSSEMINNTLCVLLHGEKEFKTSIYTNLLPNECLGVSNFNERIVYSSFKNIELCDDILDSMNSLVLNLLLAYEKSKDKKYLNLADKLSQMVCKNRNNDVDLINMKQIKYRKKGLSYIDKKLLNEISEKELYKDNYLILCCIDILLNNNFAFDMHYKKMKKEDKKVFDTWPIKSLMVS